MIGGGEQRGGQLPLLKSGFQFSRGVPCSGQAGEEIKFSSFFVKQLHESLQFAEERVGTCSISHSPGV